MNTKHWTARACGVSLSLAIGVIAQPCSLSAQGSARLEGIVRNQQGLGIWGADVLLVSPDTVAGKVDTLRAVVDSFSRYQLQVPAGRRWNIYVRRIGYPRLGPIPIELAANQRIARDIVLPPALPDRGIELRAGRPGGPH
jgi:hypothetical protein